VAETSASGIPDVGRPIYDLTVPLVDGMDWYGEHDTAPAQVHEIGSLADQGWRSHWLSLMVLNGTTYLETAAHISADAPTLDQIPPERFITRAFVVKLAPESQEVPAPDCELEGFAPGVDSLLLYLGWEEHLYSPLCYGEATARTSRRPCRSGSWPTGPRCSAPTRFPLTTPTTRRCRLSAPCLATEE